MLVFNYKIKIGNYIFGNKNKALSSLEINSSWKALGDTCTIKLGNLKKQLNNAIKVGDEIEVYLGYKNKPLNLEFKGFVTEIKPNQPFEIFCKDYVWLLERKYVSKAWATANLVNVIRELVPTANISKQVPKILLSPYRIDKATLAQSLKKIRDDFGLVAYFRQDILFVGLAYGEVVEGNPRFVLNSKQSNVTKNTDLVFKSKDDVRIKIKAVSYLPKNKKIEVEAGDIDGETRTFISEVPISDKAILKARAEREVEKYKYSGYKGDITTFGIPFCIHSQICEIVDTQYLERSGKYFIDKVVTTVSKSDGFKRKVSLGKKFS